MRHERTTERDRQVASCSLRIGLVAAALFLAAGSAPHAKGAEGEPKIKYDRILQLCENFHALFTPPPPVEAVLIGTLDAQTGTFRWGPTIKRKEKENTPDLTLDLKAVDLKILFNKYDIRPVVINLDPNILGSASLPANVRIDLTQLNQAVAAAAQQQSGPMGATAQPAQSGQAKSPAATRALPGGAARRSAGGKIATDADAPVARDTGFTGPSGFSYEFHAPVRAAKVDMVFKVINRPPDAELSLTVDGRNNKVQGDTVDLIVPPRVWAKFALSCGDKKFEDVIIFDRPPIVGCFALEAFPVVIVYEPPGRPADAGSPGSQQTYTTIKQIGKVIKTFRSEEDDHAEPVDTEFTRVGDFIDLLEGAAPVVKGFYPEVGEGMEKAAGVLAAAWGDIDIEETISHTVTEEHALSIQLKDSEAISTVGHLGPGKGDVIYYLIKPTFVWLAAQDNQSGNVYLTVSLLGYQGVYSSSAEGLRTNAMSVPSPDMQALLLAQDTMAPEYEGSSKKLPVPVLGGQQSSSSAEGNPAPGRLVPAEPFERGFEGSAQEYTFSRTIEQSDIITQSSCKTTTTTEEAGFLSYVFTNAPQDQTNTVRIEEGTSTGTSVSETVEVEVRLESPIGEGHIVHCFYDKLYGTFAFQEVQTPSEGAVSGAITSESGEPASNQDVLIKLANGLVTAVRTDEQGRFTFRSPILGNGEHTIMVGDKKLPVKFEGKPIKDLSIKLGDEPMAGAKPKQENPPPTKVDMRGGGSTTQPHINEPDTAMAIRGRPNPGFTITPNPKLKGRLGRIVVQFPKDAPCAGTKVEFFNPGQESSFKSDYGSQTIDAMPGARAVSVGGKRVDVTVESKSDTMVAVGAIYASVASDTKIELIDSDQKTVLNSGYGEQQWGLLPGKYYIRVSGLTEPVEVSKDVVTDF